MASNDKQETDIEIEELLSTELQQYCSSEGKETDPKKSAKIFHKLGLIYKNRSPDKIALIQGAALLNAAIVRNPDNVEEIKQDLEIFCDHLLITANAQLKCADLVALSTQIKQEIIQMRQKTEGSLANLSFIPMKISDQEFAVAKENKIESMASLQSEITEDFKKIMQKVAWISKSIMGKPPCEFALVGLGSLARKEVTPYSDFESIIVLKEGVHHSKSYEKVLEYFRWFSVIFQIVLLNLGETILPCVNISSIRGFYDENTPRGISFDGMVPYACKTPLGRPYKTFKKPFTLELIQPVSIMANFTDADQDLKNGYHLADMLKSTSFVYGNLLVYNEFEEQVWQKKCLISPCDEAELSPIYNQLKENKNELSETFLVFSGKFNGSVKRIFYRTSTLFIAALANIFQIRESSCFKIIDKLYELQKISALDHLNLKFAVAVACESRLQFYTKKKSQFDLTKYTSDTDGVLKLCGEKSIVEYIAITTTIQNNILQKNMDFTLKPHVMLKAYYNLQLYEAAIAWNNSHLQEYENLNDEEKGIAYRFLGMCKHRVENYKDATTDLKRAERIFRPITVRPCIALFHALSCRYYSWLSQTSVDNPHSLEGIISKAVSEDPDLGTLRRIRDIDMNKSILGKVISNSEFPKIFPVITPIIETVESLTFSDVQHFVAGKIDERNGSLAAFVKLFTGFVGAIKQLNCYDMVDSTTAAPEIIENIDVLEKLVPLLKPIVIRYFTEENFGDVHPATRKAIIEYFGQVRDLKPITVNSIAAEFIPPLD